MIVAHQLDVTSRCAQPSRRKQRDMINGNHRSRDRFRVLMLGLEQELRPAGDAGSHHLDYDSAGRLWTKTFPLGTITRTYHPTTGKLWKLNGPGLQQIEYAPDGPVMADETWSGVVAATISRQHDENGWLREEQVGSEPVIVFDYDDDGLLEDAGELTIVRDPDNGRVVQTVAGVVSDMRTYDDFGALDTYVVSDGTQTVYDLSFKRDDLGRITQKTEIVLGVQHVWDYEYDLAGRLDLVELDGNLYEDLGYDDNGNRTGYITPAGSISGTYDDQDRIETYGPLTFGHDPGGELTSRTDTTTSETTSYTYDSLGSLLTVTKPGPSIVDYETDGLNRRILRTVDATHGGAFVWRSPLQPLARLGATGGVEQVYVYAGGVNVPELIRTSTNTYRVIKDHLGSVRLVLDIADGSPAQVMRHDAWGVVLENTAPGSQPFGFQPFGFAGGLYDHKTELVRFGARDYDPAIGRWMAKDALRYFSKETGRYAYSRNDPVNYFDPTGKVAWAIPALGGGAGLLVVAGVGVGLIIAAIIVDEVEDADDDTDAPPDGDDAGRRCSDEYSGLMDHARCCRAKCDWRQEDPPKCPSIYRDPPGSPLAKEYAKYKCFERCSTYWP